MKTITSLLFLGIVASLSSCSTTGDPRSGGIFWSESKAKERVRNLKQESDYLDGEVQQLQQKNRALKKKL